MNLRGHHDAAIDLLCDQPDRLEPGLVVLEPRLRLSEEVGIDVLLRDALGYPVVVLLSAGDVARDLARLAAVLAALQAGRFLIGKLFGDKGLDVAQRPRFVLLAPRFPDHAPALLDLMAQVEIHALEFRVVRSSVGRSVLDLQSFHRTSGPSLSWKGSLATPAPAAPPPPPRPPVGELKPVDPAPAAEADLLAQAREAIAALSPRVLERREGDRHVFNVQGRPLATLWMQDGSLRLRVGEDADALGVPDEAALNEQLDLVFERFFNVLDTV